MGRGRGDRVPIPNPVALGSETGTGPLSVSPEFSCGPPGAGEFSSADSRPDLLHLRVPHPSWLEEEILELLQEMGGCLCVADTDENPADEIIHTASWGYLRLHRADYPEAELEQWRDKILAQPWQQAFVFFKHEEAKGPEMAIKFRALTDARVKEN